MDDLDNILNSALRSYVDREPPVGMERRVESRLRQPVLRRWWRFVPAVAAFCGGICLMLLNRPAPLPVLTPPVLPVPPQSGRVITRNERTRNERLPRHRTRSPEPLSEARKALLQFVKADPATAVKILGESRDRETAPLVIEALNIKPLKIEALKTEEQTQ